MDNANWRQISYGDLDELEDGTEIIWEKQLDVWETVKVKKVVKGKLKEVKEQRLKGVKYEPYRTILSKYHHKTVSGYIYCLVEAPNGEFPYPTPWASDWTYAMCGAFSKMYVRRKEDHDQML